MTWRVRSWFNYQRELAKVHHEYARLDRIDTSALSENDVRGIRLEREKAQDEWQVLTTRRLIEQAEYYGLPLPRYEEERAWDVTGTTGLHVLTLRATSDLRSAIRREQNERWQFWELRTKVIVLVATSVTGTIGTLIGLIAILKK